MVAQSEIESTLRAALPKLAHMEIQDQSSGCGENYYVLVVSDDFEGLITLKRHRLVNEILRKQIAEMHAFSQVRRALSVMMEPSGC
ncbi:bola-like protein [Calocera cornea HHB12733]|uniref:Bola-like protein n=1 Tax=Calocera cornea HHB12733 TaxID=1353952 RepID=A0A165GM22_9BASI|nr:bola-like protein [Calocera cornea HHB12733]